MNKTYYIEYSVGPKDEKCRWVRQDGAFHTLFEAIKMGSQLGYHPYRVVVEHN